MALKTIKSPILFVAQKLAIGNTWNGTIPTTTPVYPNDTGGVDYTISYPVGTAGGRFNLPYEKNQFKKHLGVTERVGTPLVHVEQFSLKLGGQSVWTVSATNGTDTYIAYSGTNETSVFYQDLHWILEPGWYIVLNTTDNATSENMARFYFGGGLYGARTIYDG